MAVVMFMPISLKNSSVSAEDTRRRFVRLVFEEDGRPVALMTWAAACYCLKAHAFAGRLTNAQLRDLYFPTKKDAKGNVTFAGYSALVPLVWDAEAKAFALAQE